jgi:hypothetical protein
VPPVRSACTVLVLAAALSACGLTRGPQTLAEQTARTAERLAAAPTPDARRAVAVTLFAEAGLTPLAGLRSESGARFEVGALVAGFVPGRRAGFRDTLVVLAAAIDGPHAATLVEAARLIAEQADTHGDAPQRSVLAALWPAGLTPDDGLAAVRAFPLWPPGAVRLTVVLADGPPGGLARPGFPVAVFQTAGLPASVNAADLSVSVLAAASAAPTD